MKVFNRWSKWELLEIYIFDYDYFTVHVRMNLNTGFKQFKVKKIINKCLSHLPKVSPEHINKIGWERKR